MGDAQRGAKSGAISDTSAAGVTPPAIATDPDLAVVAAAWAALPAAVRAGVVALVRAALPSGWPRAVRRRQRAPKPREGLSAIDHPGSVTAMPNFESLFADPRHYRGDCRLVRTAIRRGWLDDLPQAARDALVARFDAVTATRHAADPDGRNVRAMLAESLVVLELSKANASPIFRALRYAWDGATTERTTGRPRERWYVTDYPDRIDARALHAIHVAPAGTPGEPGQRVALVVPPAARVGWRLWLVCPRCGSRRVHSYPINASVLCRSCAGIRYGFSPAGR